MLIEVSDCPLCQSTFQIPYKTTVGRPILRAQTPVGDFPAYPIITYKECVDCGMVFQSPRMDDKSLTRYYADGHYREWVGMTSEQMDKDEEERSISVMSAIGGVLLVPGVLISSHLDIGCSRGYLLEKTKAMDMQVTGVDLNVDYIEDKSIPVIAHIKDTRRQFDLVTSIHTLEHVAYPLQELKTYYDVTAKDGWLILEVPSNDSPGGSLRMAHLLHFQPSVLLKAVTSAG